MFSSRLPADLRHNAVTRALERARAASTPLLDLTETNPTTVGLEYPAALLGGLADERNLRYAPSPFGAIPAREAVAAEYARQGVRVCPSRIALTASTSEAYAFLFKLLCEPGDEVLVPRPSYPLLDHLARLDAVRSIAYRTEYQGGRWSIDLDDLASRLTPRTRVLVIVTPGNPTGAVVSPGELEQLIRVCAERDVALIADEVFVDYPYDLTSSAASARALSRDEVLAFALGGISKSLGLPQLKLGWIAVAGPGPRVSEACSRLEVVCDTYLSVGTPVQRALPSLLAEGRVVRERISERIRGNLRALRRVVTRFPACELQAGEGGWSSVVRVPATIGEETLILELIERDRVVAHPGFFFDFEREAYVVLSLLPRPDGFLTGVTRLLARASHHVPAS